MSNYLKKLEEIKKKAHGSSESDGATEESSTNNQGSNNSSQSVLERVKARANGTYKPTETEKEDKPSVSMHGLKGYQKYLDDVEVESKAPQYDLNGDGQDAWWEKLIGYLGGSGGGVTDTSMPTAGVTQTINDLRADDSYRRPNDDWSDEQKSQFGLLYLESKEKAFSFAEETNNKNNAAKEKAAIKEIQDSATDNLGAGIGHTLGAIATAPLGLADYLSDLAYANAGRDIAPDGQVSPFEYSQAVTGGISEHLNETGGTLDESIPIIGGKGWGDVYGLGTSIAQSMASAYTLGGAGTLVSYFGQGAAAGVDDALARGATDEQAVLYGTAVGTFEGVAEMIGIDNLFKLGSASTIKGVIKNILKQAVAEGAEEGVTTVLSNIADAWVMQDKSNFAYQIDSYMSEGMSETDAKWKVFWDSLEGIAFDTIAGSVSGGVSGGIHTGAQTIADNHYAKKTYAGAEGDLVNEALDIDPNNATAQAMKERLDAGKKLSGGQINRLVEAKENALVSQDKAKMKSAVEARLTELGESGDIGKLADVIVKAQSGDALTRSERSILMNSKHGRRVSTELNPRSIESGEYTSAWAENLGTERINAEAYNRGTSVPTIQVGTTPVTKNATVKETPAEAKIEASTNAKVTIEKDGETVTVKPQKIASIEGDVMTIELDSGEVVDATEVEFGDSQIGLVYQAAKDMSSRVGGFNIDTANVFVRGFTPGQGLTAAEYVHGFSDAYRFGKMGYPVSELARGVYTSKLTEEQKKTAYNFGKVFGNEEIANKSAKIASTSAINAAKDSQNGTKKRKGRVHFDGKVVGKNLTERQKASLKGLGVVAEAMGIDIHVFESPVGKDGKRQGSNGWYDPKDNSVHIDLYAGVKGDSLMLFTASHELTHHIREVAPAKFKIFADALLEEYSKNGKSVEELIQDKMEFLKEKGRITPDMSEDHAYDLAYEEVVADSCEAMLVDSNAIEALSRKLHEQDKGLWQTIKDFITNLVARVKAAYKGLSPDSAEANYVRDMVSSTERLQKLWVDALLEASEVQSSAETTLLENGISVDANTESASLFSVRDVLSDADRKKVSKALATRFGVTQEEAVEWLNAETSLASLILNPKYSQYLDYTPDPNEVAIKQNSDYPQGTVDFSPICAKRREFTAVMNNILRLFPNHVFAATDLAKIRTIMQEEGMTIPCGICYVEDRRQLDTIVAQNFIDSLKLYREGSKTRPDGKPFNTNQLNGLKLIDGNDYTPSIYELVSLEGLNLLKEKNPQMAEAWIKFNNARGMQSVRLLANEAEYKRQILKYNKNTIKSKNDKGGLRVYSFSDMEMFHLIDIIQVITDSATVGLSLQGYTKVNEYARAVKDTGEKLNRSLIPKGDLGYHIEDGKVVLDYDTVEGIDINHPDFFDNMDNPNIGNITIGVSDVQIRAAMVSDFVDQIIPFHTGQSEEVLGEKGISTWDNYKDFQKEKDIATGTASDHQINIYTEVLQVLEKEGKPITKRTFVEKFLQVCKENNLTPRFSQFLNTNEHGEYTYTEGYHKFLVDFKTFDQRTGEYLPQMPVKPIFDNEYITKILKDYVKSQKVKDAEIAKSMPAVVDRITKEIVNPDGVKHSDRATSKSGYGAMREALAKDGLDELSEKLGNYFPLSASFDATMRADDNPLTMTTVKKGGVAWKKGESAFTVGKRAFRNAYGTKTDVHVKQMGIDAVLYTDVTNESISKVVGKKDKASEQTILDVIPHVKEILSNSILASVERINHTDNKKTVLYGYRLYNLYWLEENNKKTPHCLVCTVVQNTEQAEGYVFRDIENVTIDHGLPGKTTDMPASVNDDTYTISQLYRFVKGVKREDGGIKYSAEEKAKYLFPYTKRRNGVLYSDRPSQKASYSDRDSLGNELSEAQQEFFKDSKVRDKKGNLMVLYHGTTAKFNTFKKGDVGFHFGTKGAARGRVGFGKNVTLKEVYLNITNPIVFDEDLGSWDADFRLTRELYDKGILTQAEAESVLFTDDRQYKRTTEAANKKLASVLLEKGYDGIAYSNTFETKKATTSYIVFNSNQAKDITNKTPTSNPDIRYSDRDSYAPTFYSHMGKVIDDIKLEKMGTSSILNHLKNRGVKDEEIKWSGIETFLEGKKSVTKAELQEFVAGSQLQIVEQVSGEDIDLRYDGSKRAYNLYDSNGKVIDTFTYNEFLDGYVADSDEEIYSNEIELREALREIHGKASAPRWADYRLDGGSNYRELVFQLPDSTYSNRAMRAHWGEEAEGVLAHARIQDMTTSDGKRMLFIEELQSDWHNEGHQKGYTTEEYEEAVAVYDKLAEDYANKRRAFNKYVRSGEFRSDPDEVSKKKFDWLRRKMDEAEKRMQDAERDIDALKEKGMGDVPDAPFRDNYHEYVLKRLLRMAAEEGYDSIGWTTADTQSKRWSEDYAEGYRIEYDQDIPKFFRKYGKKWGATVGKTYVDQGWATANESDIAMDKRHLAIWQEKLKVAKDEAQAAYIREQIEYHEKQIAAAQVTGESVWSMDITDSMKDSVLYDGQTLYQDRPTESFSNRSLLANALESTVQNDIERAKLKQYKEKIDLINSEEQKLHELREKIKTLSFAKGARDTGAIKKLQFEANQAANRINTYDRQLLNLESTKALKGVLDREKAQARKRAEQRAEQRRKDDLAKAKERAAKTQRELMNRYQESRKKGIESRNKTAMRHKIKGIVSELNTLLLNPTAKKHIKEELRKEVADALSAINMDTVDADARVAKYNALIARENDPDIIAELTKTRDNIQLQGDNLKEKLTTLQTAYEKIKSSEDIELSLSYQEVIHNSIKNVVDKVGSTSVRNMTLEQLEMVYDLFKMIRHTIRDANKSFKEKKGQTIMQMAEAVNDQVRTVGGQPYKRNAIVAAMQRVGWTFLKPYVAFRTIGSITLTNLYKELRVGEDTFYEDVKEAQAFIEEQYKKHGYKSWDMKKTKTFTAKSGKTFDLTLEQMMTLYAYSKREQAHKHIIEGGIVFEDALIVEKNKLGVPIKYEVTTKDAFNLSEETFAEIANSLTAEQKAFVDAMQAYLSVTMGAKGNEVSMELLGVKLFKEEFYLPIKSSQDYMNFSAEEAGEVKLKSPAFSKETVKRANNPIVLHNFTDLWAEHINDMSMYHSFVLALEDFTKVYNYKTKTDAKVETMATKATLETAYPGVTKYINKFLKDMNGGVRSETVGWAEKLTSLSKKGAVLGSASVTIQQPSAVMRAMGMVSPKYFVTTAHKSFNLAKHKQDFEELKKYAPIAGIKEMGRFDVGMGQGTVDWIKSNKNVMEKGEDILSFPPALMDEITWVTIWNAVKRETLHNHKDLAPTSDEFLKIAGERFTDVISLTQVYDSVFARSDLMRNKSWIAKAMTAFMAEPTTTLNMIWDGWVQAKRTGGFKAYAKATVTTGAPIVSAIVLNAALKSIIMAMRDDDEDESYAEKYLEHFAGEIADNLNPLTLVPIVKDVVSIFKGYDVERMDMALFSDFKKALDAFDSEDKTLYEKWSGFINAVSAFFGVPAKNVERDIRGLINTFFGESEDTTAMGILNSIEEGWTGESKSNGQQLYEAMLNGDSEQIERVKGRFKDQSAINTAIRKALRENDPRIKEAAEARYNGDIAEYMNIAKEIIREGNFKQDDVVAAINSEINDIKKRNGETETSTPSNKVVSLYNIEDYYTAIVGGDDSTAYAVKYDLIETEVANGKDRDEAESSFNSKFVSHIRDLYEAGDVTSYKAEELLVNYGGKSKEEASSKVQYWSFKKEYPDYDLSEEAVKKYYSEVKSSGISVAVYYDYSKQRAEAKGVDLNGDGKTDSGSVKSEVMQIINSLPISYYQKDVLYYLNGWSQSTIGEAPWH